MVCVNRFAVMQEFFIQFKHTVLAKMYHIMARVIFKLEHVQFFWSFS
jgi:hypothetical protein